MNKQTEEKKMCSFRKLVKLSRFFKPTVQN